MARNTFTIQADNSKSNFWDTVGVTANGEIFDNARRFCLHLEVGQSNEDFGIESGGLLYGDDKEAPPSVTTVVDMKGEEEVLSDSPIFPGSFSVQIGNRAIRVELDDPRLDFRNIRVWLDGINGSDGIEITEYISEICIDINAITGSVDAWFAYADGEIEEIVSVMMH